MTKPVPPSTTRTAFSCPHCGALTTQYWRPAKVEFRDDNNKLPERIRDPGEYKHLHLANTTDADVLESLEEYIDEVASGVPLVGANFERYSQNLTNVDASECYNCGRLALWVGESIVWPRATEAPPPNADLPDDVVADYREAGAIVDVSPRGAAALLRLAVQKLCKFLGEPGDNINTDIGSLVAKGLDPRVQRMLDVVRIAGNNAVHPGEIDVRDNRELADKLFSFVNIIADIMISQPKAIDAVYGGMPEGARAQVQKRDEKSRPSK